MKKCINAMSVLCSAMFLGLVTWELMSSSIPLTFHSSLKTVWPELKDSKYTECPQAAELKVEGWEDTRKRRRKTEKGGIRDRKWEQVHFQKLSWRNLFPQHERVCVLTRRDRRKDDPRKPLEKFLLLCICSQPVNHQPVRGCFHRGQLSNIAHWQELSGAPSATHKPTPKTPTMHLSFCISYSSYLHPSTSLFRIRPAGRCSTSLRTSRLSPCSPARHSVL